MLVAGIQKIISTPCNQQNRKIQNKNVKTSQMAAAASISHQNLGNCFAKTAFSIGISKNMEHPSAYLTMSRLARTESTSG